LQGPDGALEVLRFQKRHGTLELVKGLAGSFQITCRDGSGIKKRVSRLFGGPTPELLVEMQLREVNLHKSGIGSRIHIRQLRLGRSRSARK
jgi:hypothetical protein